MNDGYKQILLDIISQAPGKAPFVDGGFKDQVAEICCSQCYQLFTWGRIEFVTETCCFLCDSCREQRQSEKLKNHLLSILRHPLFYVLSFIFFAIILYAFGVGRNSVERLEFLDQDRAPFQQELPCLYLQRAARAATRVKLLEEFGPKEDIPKWALFASNSYDLATAYWSGEKVAGDLGTASAVYLSKNGNHEEGYNQLKRIEGFISPKSQPSYYFYRGRIALLLGELSECNAAWNNVLQRISRKKTDFLTQAVENIEEMISTYSLERTEERWVDQVRRLTFMELPEVFMGREILAGFDANNINSSIAKEFAERFASDLLFYKEAQEGEEQPLVEKF